MATVLIIVMFTHATGTKTFETQVFGSELACQNAKQLVLQLGAFDARCVPAKLDPNK